MKRMLLIVAVAVLAVVSLRAAEPATQPTETRELLSEHKTIARFTGLIDRKCMGRTSLCPDRCGHSGPFATFEIVHYLHYDKPGQYGEEPQSRWMFHVQDNMGNVKEKPEIVAAARALQVGGLVYLEWRHDYVTRTFPGGGTGKFPDRPVIKLQAVTDDEAQALIAGAATQPAPATQPGSTQE
jgi:hypothetical protein